TAGVVGNETVTAKDAFGNTATSYRGTVQFSGTDGQAVFPANYTFTAADAGSHTFSLSLRTAGSQTVVAFDTANTSVAGPQRGHSVSQAGAPPFVVSRFPSPVSSGTTANLVVRVQDPYGNTATAYAGTVHFTSTDTQANLPANYTFTAADAGQHVFTITMRSI